MENCNETLDGLIVRNFLGEGNGETKSTGQRTQKNLWENFVLTLGTSDEHITVVENLRDYNPDGAILVTTPQVQMAIFDVVPVGSGHSYRFLSLQKP